MEMRRTLGLLGVLTVATVVLGGCGDAGRAGPRDRATALPPTYTYVLDSTCGERNLIGTYAVRVEDGRVRAATPLDATWPSPDLADVPTLAELAARGTSGEDAVVEYRTDDSGLPAVLRLDPLPRSIDDEECYRVRDVAAGPASPVVALASPWDSYPAAQVRGRLRLEQDCLLVGDALVLWPAGTAWDDVARAVVLGDDRIEVGERVDAGGGYYERTVEAAGVAGPAAAAALEACSVRTGVAGVVVVAPD